MGARGPVGKRTSTTTLEPISSIPEPPRRLNKAGRDAWRVAFRQCGAWLTNADLPIVERFAELHDERADLRVAIEDSGRTTRGSQGQLVDHPLVGQLRAVENLILRHEQVLGMGPVNRARLGIATARAAKERSNAERALEAYRRALEAK